MSRTETRFLTLVTMIEMIVITYYSRRSSRPRIIKPADCYNIRRAQNLYPSDNMSDLLIIDSASTSDIIANGAMLHNPDTINNDIQLSVPYEQFDNTTPTMHATNDDAPAAAPATGVNHGTESQAPICTTRARKSTGVGSGTPGVRDTPSARAHF